MSVAQRREELAAAYHALETLGSGISHDDSLPRLIKVGDEIPRAEAALDELFDRLYALAPDRDENRRPVVRVTPPAATEKQRRGTDESA